MRDAVRQLALNLRPAHGDFVRDERCDYAEALSALMSDVLFDGVGVLHQTRVVGVIVLTIDAPLELVPGAQHVFIPELDEDAEKMHGVVSVLVPCTDDEAFVGGTGSGFTWWLWACNS